MVDCHGSQCGFCTPGLRDVAVVDLRAPPGRRHAADAPAAGRRPVGQPVPLHRLPADPRCRPAHVRPAGGARSTPRRWSPRCRRLDRGERAPSSYADAHSAGADRPLVHAPTTLAELAALRERPGGAGCWPARPTSACGSTSSSATLGDIIYVGDVAEMKRGRRRVDGELYIGAGASLEAAWARARAARCRADRRLAALRLAADPQCRHDGRQRRQRLADRRLAAGADGARCRRSSCARARACAACRWPTSTSTT